MNDELEAAVLAAFEPLRGLKPGRLSVAFDLTPLVPTTPPTSPFGNVIEEVGEIGVKTVSERDNVTNANVDRRLAEELRRRREDAEVATRLALIDGWGADTYPDRTVLRIDKSFRLPDGATKSYTYVALKATGKWWLTGRSFTGARTWDQLVLWLVTDEDPVSVGRAELLVPRPAWVTLQEEREPVLVTEVPDTDHAQVARMWPPLLGSYPGKPTTVQETEPVVPESRRVNPED